MHFAVEKTGKKYTHICKWVAAQPKHTQLTQHQTQLFAAFFYTENTENAENELQSQPTSSTSVCLAICKCVCVCVFASFRRSCVGESNVVGFLVVVSSVATVYLSLSKVSLSLLWASHFI